MISRFVCAGLLLAASTAQAQQTRELKFMSLTALGAGYGYNEMEPELHIGGNPLVAGLADFYISPTMTMNVRTEYISGGATNTFMRWLPSQAAPTAMVQEFEDVTWRNASLVAVAMQKVSDASSLGVGLGVEYMRYHRCSIMPEERTIDELTHEVSYKQAQYVLEWVRVSPSASAVAHTAWSLPAGVRVIMLISYKFIFPGSSVTRNPIAVWNSVGITFAVMHELGK